MSAIDNGGPAFPNWSDNHYTDQRPRGGMSLRDYFMASAAIGCLAAFKRWPDKNDGKRIAEVAVQIADALIAARETE